MCDKWMHPGAPGTGALFLCLVNAPKPDYAGHWAEASIQRVVEAGLMSGRSKGFGPNEPITRAEVAVILDRLLKKLGN